jgi:exodeoxyribonuclease III
MKLASWNVNGLRACGRNGFLKWFENEGADVVCVQEIKANPEQLDDRHRNPFKYHAFWHPAEKPGYSGVAVYTKKEPLSVDYGIGVRDIDREGRVLALKFPKFTVMSCYFPNSQRDHARLPYKLKFCEKFLKHVELRRQSGENILICGDFNIAHKEIDLKNPKTNQENPGFLPQERAWMDQFVEKGYVDVFRKFESGGGHYTWWSYRPGVREKNVGWRLDYFFSSPEFSDRLKSASHRCDIWGSDHCPVVIELK